MGLQLELQVCDLCPMSLKIIGGGWGLEKDGKGGNDKVKHKQLMRDILGLFLPCVSEVLRSYEKKRLHNKNYAIEVPISLVYH